MRFDPRTAIRVLTVMAVWAAGGCSGKDASPSPVATAGMGGSAATGATGGGTGGVGTGGNATGGGGGGGTGGGGASATGGGGGTGGRGGSATGGGSGSGGSGGAGAAPMDAGADVTGIRDAATGETRAEAGGGACTNAADQGVIGNSAKFEQDITDCGTTCFFLPGDKATCASDCMRGKGLSSGCAACYGGQIACGMVTCSAPCMLNSSSPECRTCVMQNCEPPFRACAGDPPARPR
jgi:hypothetical protein